MGEFYSADKRKEILKEMSMPENNFKGMSEKTGLKILDGIYILIEMLRKDELNGAEKSKPILEEV